jgi:hypothetical protein
MTAAAFAVAPAGVAQSVADEYRVKAAFISKFPQFVDWPGEVWNAPGPFELCVVRPNPFGSVLSELVDGEAVRGRRLAVREIDRDGSVDRCRILFIPSGLSPGRTPAFERALRLPTLTVSDDGDFLSDGGIIGLHVAGGRVRFDVNVAQAARVDLRLSSLLLRLAGRVIGGGS